MERFWIKFFRNCDCVYYHKFVDEWSVVWLVVVDLVGGRQFYVDNRLHKDLSAAKGIVKQKDEDRVFLVDGEERSGKSVLTMQLAMIVDPSFTIERIVYTPEDFRVAVISAKKGQAIIFDEAFKGLSSKGTMSEINKLLVSLMMEMGQKNLFVFIVLPTFFELQKYIAVFRSYGLFHVYRKGGKRGYWVYFNKRKKQLLYDQGKKNYSYSGKTIPKTGYRGRFLDQYVIDEKAYRKLKFEALQKLGSEDEDVKDLGLDGRNRLLWLLKEEFGLSLKQVEVLVKKYGVFLSFQTISKAIKKVKG